MSAQPEDTYASDVTEADIIAAYRIILNRQADPEGLAHLKAQAKKDMTLPELRNILLGSEEYRVRFADYTELVDIGGISVVIDPHEPEFGQAIASNHTWEAHIRDTLRRVLKPGDVYVDIGANVGVMSFTAAQSVGESGKVIAFEPNPDNAQNFLRGVVANRFTNVVLYPLAASDGHAIFSLQGNSNTWLSSSAGSPRLIASITADTLLGQEDRVDVVKIDIEGHEPRALKGMQMMLRRCKPLLICEFNPLCLLTKAGAAPEHMAAQIFELTKSVDIIEESGGLTTISSADDLMAVWRERDLVAADSGRLPEGWLHFDLLFQVI